MKRYGVCFFLTLALVWPGPIRSQPAVSPAAVPAPAAKGLDGVICWDASSKRVTVNAGTPEAHYVFNLTNISSANVVINSAVGSCGCTVARLPVQPWTLGPGSNGQINVTMNLAGKSGTVPKIVTVSTDRGNTQLSVTTTIVPASEAPGAAVGMDRSSNQKLALADRQAVFKGDCARCHVLPTVGKMGAELYQAACGICHEVLNRASMVPNLHALNKPTDSEYWRNWIAQGKPGSLMPAFSMAQGGVLTDDQIGSLATYLSAAIPSRPAVPAFRLPSQH